MAAIVLPAGAQRAAAVAVAFMLTLAVGGAAAQADEAFGRFDNDLIVKLNTDGRTMKLVRPFSYRDPKGTQWRVPEGAVVDGASIPVAFWSLIGGPLSGKYREASVVHDHYCSVMSRPWKDVHLAFYNAMRANGVSRPKAMIMYSAVYRFGPRWVGVKTDGAVRLVRGRPFLSDTAREAIIRYVEQRNPTLAEMQVFLQDLEAVRSAQQLEDLLSRHAGCTPIIGQSDTGSDVRASIILCDLDKRSKTLAALSNVRSMKADLERLVAGQSGYLLPAAEAYIAAPNPQNWRKLQVHLNETVGLIKVSMRSVLTLEEPLDPAIKNTADTVFGILSARSTAIGHIIRLPPQSAVFMRDWKRRYTHLVDKLKREIANLEQALSQA